MSAETYPPVAGSDERCSGTGVAPNVADLVRSAVLRGPAHPALIDAPTGDSLTWAELDAAVTAEAVRLRSEGASAGDRVALRLPTGIAFCVALFGVLRAGCVAVPLPPSSSGEKADRILADSGARILVAEAAPSDLGSGMTALGAPRADPGAAPAAEPELPRTGGSDLAVIAYTSGVSGPPRGAMLPHRALLANVRQCGRMRPMLVNAADQALLALPLFHAYGMGPGLLQVASVGATAVLMPDFEPEYTLEAIARYRVTTVIGVPPMYDAWSRLPPSRLRDRMSTVRMLTSGAAPLGTGVVTAVRTATGLDVFEGYGLTEAGPVLTTTLAAGRAKPGSVGLPIPGVDLRLVDSDGTPLPSGAAESDPGLLAARGANLFTGYWPDGRHGPDEQGWFQTGDVGYFDTDGDLRLADRATDLITVHGFDVYPHEVEGVLLELDAVAEAAVIGVPEESRGESIKAIVVLAEGCGVTVEDVREHCARRLPRFKVPALVEFADVLPRSPIGKVIRHSLRT